MCFDKGNITSWNKKVSTFKIRLLCFQGEILKYRGCQNSVEDCTLGAGLMVVEKPPISAIIIECYNFSEKS